MFESSHAWLEGLLGWADLSVRGERLQIAGASGGASASLELCYVLSLQSFGTFCHFEFNIVAFVKRLESSALNGAVMHKNVIARITADKAIAFFVIKPLDGSLFFHLFS
jgi:hypothetical protein